MRRRLPAVFLAALLTFAVSACGDDSDDSDAATNDETTGQTDGATDDTDPTETDDADDADDTGDADDAGDDRDDKDGGDKDRDDKDGGDKKDSDGDGDKNDDDADENGAIPDDLESGEPDDPDGLPIDAQVVLDTCEDVDPKDTWPAAGDVSFDAGDSNVVATADVEVKGGQSMKVVCDVAGSESNPQVKAYTPLG